MENGGIEVPSEIILEQDSIHITPIGVTFDSTVPHEPSDVAKLFDYISGLRGSLKLCLGDILLFADRTWGDEFYQYLSQSYTYGYIQNIKWVAKYVGEEARQMMVDYEGIHWSHLQEVAPFHNHKEQVYWLNIALMDGLTTKELKERIRLEKYLKEPGDTQLVIPKTQITYQQLHSSFSDLLILARSFNYTDDNARQIIRNCSGILDRIGELIDGAEINKG